MSESLHFPTGFLWGTASSAYQTEGNNGNNQWTDFEQQPGAIRFDHRNGLACDWWRNAEADFDRMQQLGLNTHRLSLEWKVSVQDKVPVNDLSRHGLTQRIGILYWI